MCLLHVNGLECDWVCMFYIHSLSFRVGHLLNLALNECRSKYIILCNIGSISVDAFPLKYHTIWFVVSCRDELIKGIDEILKFSMTSNYYNTCIRILWDNRYIYSIFLCRLIHVLSKLIIQCIVSILSYNCCTYVQMK